MRNEYVSQALLALSLTSASLRALVTFMFAAAIAVNSTVSLNVRLNGPLGSGRFGFCFTGWKYSRLTSNKFLPSEIF